MAISRPHRTADVRRVAGNGGDIQPEARFSEQDLEDRAGDALPAGLGGGDSLTIYLREIRRTQLFTPDEEYRTACAARSGDFAAR